VRFLGRARHGQRKLPGPLQPVHIARLTERALLGQEQAERVAGRIEVDPDVVLRLVPQRR
jgi:hypothetical protein